MKLLLLSNSTLKGEGYLAWPMEYIKAFITGHKKILFVPYAGVTMSYDEYTQSVQKALGRTVEVQGIHSFEDKLSAIRSAECIAVGGGNTFHLLAKMQEESLVHSISKKVREGTPYIGWSAGSNVACPTIMTTNDMPIVQPESFSALGLTNFQINAHYTERTIDGHGGESRKQRLEEFLEANTDVSVVGLPEGKLLQLDSGKWFLKGIESEPTLLLNHGGSPVELAIGPVPL